MFPLSRNVLAFAAAGALIALTAVSPPARSDELVQNLGPVRPHEPMIAAVGSKHVIAFFVPGNGTCNLQVVVWSSDDTDEAHTAAGFRTSLNPGETASIDSAESKSLTLRCGDYAETLGAAYDTQSLASK